MLGLVRYILEMMVSPRGERTKKLDIIVFVFVGLLKCKFMCYLDSAEVTSRRWSI